MFLKEQLENALKRPVDLPIMIITMYTWVYVTADFPYAYPFIYRLCGLYYKTLSIVMFIIVHQSSQR